MFFADYIRNTSKKIDDLWQSKDKKYGNIKFGCALSFFCALIFICGYYFNTGQGIIRFIVQLVCGYLAFIFLFATILGGITYNINNSSKKYKLVCISIFKIILWLFIICIIPFLIVMKVLELSVGSRAKKLDNVFNVLYLVFIEFFVVIFVLWRPNLFLSVYIESIIKKLVNNSENLNYNFIIISIFIFMIVVECLLLLEIIIRIIKYLKTRNKEKGLDNNLAKYLNYDLEYLKVSIWKLMLLTLILVILSAMISTNGLFGKFSSEIKDSCTLITLFMLYLDKRNSWNKSLDSSEPLQ